MLAVMNRVVTHVLLLLTVKGFLHKVVLSGEFIDMSRAILWDMWSVYVPPQDLLDACSHEVHAYRESAHRLAPCISQLTPAPKVCQSCLHLSLQRLHGILQVLL